MPLCLRTSFLGSAYYRLLQNSLLPLLQGMGLRPNQITLLGTAIASLVPLGFYMHPFVGLLLMVASGIADSLDGLMARQHSQASVFGAFLDSTLDRLSDFFYLAGFWVLFWTHPKKLLATVIVFCALLFTLLISYIKARAQALGGRCEVGFMERGARVVYLIVWGISIALFPHAMNILLWLGLWIYCALTLATVIQRIFHVRSQVMAFSPSKRAQAGPES